MQRLRRVHLVALDVQVVTGIVLVLLLGLIERDEAIAALFEQWHHLLEALFAAIDEEVTPAHRLAQVPTWTGGDPSEHLLDLL